MRVPRLRLSGAGPRLSCWWEHFLRLAGDALGCHGDPPCSLGHRGHSCPAAQRKLAACHMREGPGVWPKSHQRSWKHVLVRSCRSQGCGGRAEDRTDF